MDKNLEAILNNSTAGSSELLLHLNSYLSDNIKSTDEFERLLPLISERFLSFAVIINYLKNLEKFSAEKNYPGFLNFLKHVEAENRLKYSAIYTKAKPLLKNISSVITLSNSNTLLEVFRLWRNDNPDIRIIIAESRPKEEGKIFAENLLKNDIRVQLITDAMIGIYMQIADAAITGADQILKTGDVVNKTGSNLLAITAKYYNKPFYIIASKDKMTESSEYIPHEYPPEEVWDHKAQNLTISNYYFETVDRRLITKLITE